MPCAKLPEWKEHIWPNLKASDYCVTSPRDDAYNCAAWAVNEKTEWWWPHPTDFNYYWPPDARRDDSREAFIEGYGTLGFVECDSSELEEGYEKIAVYFSNGEPLHVARQLPNGNWTSKLGMLDEDIEHPELNDVASVDYGQPQLFLRRPFGKEAQPKPTTRKRRTRSRR